MHVVGPGEKGLDFGKEDAIGNGEDNALEDIELRVAV